MKVINGMLNIIVKIDYPGFLESMNHSQGGSGSNLPWTMKLPFTDKICQSKKHECWSNRNSDVIVTQLIWHESVTSLRVPQAVLAAAGLCGLFKWTIIWVRSYVFITLMVKQWLIASMRVVNRNVLVYWYCASHACKFSESFEKMWGWNTIWIKSTVVCK